MDAKVELVSTNGGTAEQTENVSTRNKENDCETLKQESDTTHNKDKGNECATTATQRIEQR